MGSARWGPPPAPGCGPAGACRRLLASQPAFGALVPGVLNLTQLILRSSSAWAEGAIGCREPSVPERELPLGPLCSLARRPPPRGGGTGTRRDREDVTAFTTKALFLSRTVKSGSLYRPEIICVLKNYWKCRKLISVKIMTPLVGFLREGQRAWIQLLVRTRSGPRHNSGVTAVYGPRRPRDKGCSRVTSTRPFPARLPLGTEPPPKTEQEAGSGCPTVAASSAPREVTRAEPWAPA